nr:hypothetical protein [Tanacetum cinerariifolium]
MSGTRPPIPPPLGTSSGNSGSPNMNRVDTIPTTTDPINTTTTTNVSQSFVDENLPQLLDSRGGSHVTNVPAFDKEDFTSWKLRFLVFLDGLEPYLLKTLEDGPFIHMSAESFDWDDESVSSNDEGSTKIRAFMAIAKDEPLVGKVDDEIIDLKKAIEKWTCSKVTLDQLLSEQVPKTIVKALGGKGRRKEKISSKEVVFTNTDESSSVLAPKITFDSESECDSQEPLPPLPKLIGAAPSGTSESLIVLSDLTLNMADLTLDTPILKKTRPSVKVSPAYFIKKR